MMLITKREAKLEVLQHTAAWLRYIRFNRYEGYPVDEDDEETATAYAKMNAARLELAAELASRAGVNLEDMIWEED